MAVLGLLESALHVDWIVMPRMVGLLIVLMTAALALPGNAGADTLVAPSETDVLSLGEYGGQFAWRRYLVRFGSNVGGKAADLPAKNGLRETDVDLGLDPKGSLVMVYDGCVVGCPRFSYDLFTYDFKTGRATPLRYAAAKNCSEDAPSISRGVVVFYRSGSACSKGVYVARIGQKPRRLTDRFATPTDISGNRVAYVATDKSGADELRLQGLGATRSCLVERVSERAGEIRDAQLEGDYIYWTFSPARDDEHIRIARARGCRSGGKRAPGLEVSKRRFEVNFDYTFEIAVDSHGKIYYGDEKGVYRMDDPAPF